MNSDTIEELKNIAESTIKQDDVFLVDVEVKNAETMEVWVLVDSESEGVNIDVCSAISREIAEIIEEKNLINSAFRLNVSSPGLARPLSDLRQYGKNIGRSVKVKYKTEDEYKKIEGILADVAGDNLVIKTEDNNRETIRFNDVVETKVIPKI